MNHFPVKVNPCENPEFQVDIENNLPWELVFNFYVYCTEILKVQKKHFGTVFDRCEKKYNT